MFKMKTIFIFGIMMLLFNSVHAEQLEKISIVPTSYDARESQNIFSFLCSLKKFPEPKYHKPMTAKTIITYYEVVDKKVQDDIANLLLSEKKERKWKPIELRFMEKENLIDNGDVIRRVHEIEINRILIK